MTQQGLRFRGLGFRVLGFGFWVLGFVSERMRNLGGFGGFCGLGL